MPERPAVARVQPLDMGRDAMDRAGRIGADESAVGAHLGAMATAWSHQDYAGLQQAALDQRAKRDARLRLFGAGDRKRVLFRGRDGFDAGPGKAHIFGVTLDADKAPAEPPRHRA